MIPKIGVVQYLAGEEHLVILWLYVQCTERKEAPNGQSSSVNVLELVMHIKRIFYPKMHRAEGQCACRCVCVCECVCFLRVQVSLYVGS